MPLPVRFSLYLVPWIQQLVSVTTSVCKTVQHRVHPKHKYFHRQLITDLPLVPDVIGGVGAGFRPM